jgi:hypothetical protein
LVWPGWLIRLAWLVGPDWLVGPGWLIRLAWLVGPDGCSDPGGNSCVSVAEIVCSNVAAGWP